MTDRQRAIAQAKEALSFWMTHAIKDVRLTQLIEGYAFYAENGVKVVMRSTGAVVFTEKWLIR